ncbi:transcriptional regulator [Streptomyces spiroverticillatus]|uniref:Transcriptional regulator n=1 Tax=Streptomyces finlayi TaxID=67296 RepID=A0A918WWV2_9ACTN|nr:helix-turn-helix transcriptional regulator [Streptomyces finlayi]GHA08141.1 transcriptional regulator [Streptomyces spiroverticillatus]GHC91209.1 transcriptional regulator [Streptomyces finlayi]
MTRTADTTSPAAPVRHALGEFLRARRGRVSPERAGIAAGRRRRVQGLRREELAQLAGISVDYYVRLEQGRATQPSPEVLDALARALDLGVAERAHLNTLAGAGTRATSGGAPAARVGPVLREVFRSLDHLPVIATDHRLDAVAWNALGAELVGGLDGPHPRRDRNNARFLFLDPASRTVHPEWATRAREAVGLLRVATGQHPEDAELNSLVAELTALSEEFRTIWDSGEITMCAAGRKSLHHPATGPLTLDFESLQVPAAPGQSGLVVHVYSAAEGTPEAAALAELRVALPV